MLASNLNKQQQSNLLVVTSTIGPFSSNPSGIYRFVCCGKCLGQLCIGHTSMVLKINILSPGVRTLRELHSYFSGAE